MAKSPKPNTARNPPLLSNSHADIDDWIRRVMPDLHPTRQAARRIDSADHPWPCAAAPSVSGARSAVVNGTSTGIMEAIRLRYTVVTSTENCSTVPTEAINGHLEHLRGSALGFRNLTHYIARGLLEAGGFRPHRHPR